MVRICLCYNDDSELLQGALAKALRHYPDIMFQSYNEDLHFEKKKAYSVKGNFAAKKIPFCGVYRDNAVIKGFYSEDGGCTEKNILDYVEEHYSELWRETEEEETFPSLETLIDNFKNKQNDGKRV